MCAIKRGAPPKGVLMATYGCRASPLSRPLLKTEATGGVVTETFPTHTSPNTNDFMIVGLHGIPNESAPIEPFGRDVTGPFPTVESPPLLKSPPGPWPLLSGGRFLRDDFAPSKGRRKPTVIDSGAAFVQR